MNWTEILNAIFELVLIPLLGIIVKYGTQFISAKIAQWKEQKDDELFHKYLDQLDEAITRSVIATNQIYVDSLKDKNAFDAQAQKEAFQKTYDNIIAMLTEDARNMLSEALGDLQAYITTSIEANVKLNK